MIDLLRTLCPGARDVIFYALLIFTMASLKDELIGVDTYTGPSQIQTQYYQNPNYNRSQYYQNNNPYYQNNPYNNPNPYYNSNPYYNGSYNQAGYDQGAYYDQGVNPPVVPNVVPNVYPYYRSPYMNYDPFPSAKEVQSIYRGNQHPM